MKFFAKNRDLAGRAGLHGLNWLPNSDSKHLVMTNHHAKNQLDSVLELSHREKVHDDDDNNNNNNDDDTHQGLII